MTSICELLCCGGPTHGADIDVLMCAAGAQPAAPTSMCQCVLRVPSPRRRHRLVNVCCEGPSRGADIDLLICVAGAQLDEPISMCKCVLRVPNPRRRHRFVNVFRGPCPRRRHQCVNVCGGGGGPARGADIDLLTCVAGAQPAALTSIFFDACCPRGPL